MSINETIMYATVLFTIIGGIDKYISNKLGLGEQFEEGVMAMGSLVLSMVGIIALAPALVNLLNPIVVPVYELLGTDPVMSAITLLTNDTGGFVLMQQSASDLQAGSFAEAILDVMMGPTLIFTILIVFGIVQKDNQQFLVTGALGRTITIPFGSSIGGLTAGVPSLLIIPSLIPIITIVASIILDLWLAPKGMIKDFQTLDQGIVIVATFDLVMGAIQLLSGIIVIPGTALITEGVEVVSGAILTLADAFCLVTAITRVFNKLLMKLGKVLGMNEVAAVGVAATLANNISMLQMLRNMDNREKIISITFVVSASFVLGNHLGFAASAAKEMIFPMIAGKLAGGITVIFVAISMANRMLGKPRTEVK